MQAIPVLVRDSFTGVSHEIHSPRDVTSHGYRCPVCRAMIESCHDTALFYHSLLPWDDPNRTNPKGFSLVG